LPTTRVHLSTAFHFLSSEDISIIEMLNPPLSLLPMELRDSIVDYLGQDFWPNRHLKSLALADRSFTSLCQKRIFREFTCAARIEGGDWKQQLESFHYALATNPFASTCVKAVHLIVHARIKQETWVFHEPKFKAILAQLGRIERPPTTLGIYASSDMEVPFREPDLALKVLSESLAPSLVKLSLSFCEEVPMELFLLLPVLKELNMDHVFPRLGEGQTKELSKNPSPSLEVFSFRHSHEMLEQMFAPSSAQNQSFINFSALRVLEFGPSDEEAFPFIFQILKGAENSLEEIIATRVQSPWRKYICRLSTLPAPSSLC
jgi:hypothetical protein